MNASPLFIKVTLAAGGVAHLDLMQIVALIECATDDNRPALDIVLLGGYAIRCLDEERSGVKEVTEMKARFVQQAMNPQLVIPSQMPAVRH